MLHLQKKDKKQNEQVIFIQVAFFAVGAVLLLWYLAPWVLNRILNAGNVLGIAFAVGVTVAGRVVLKGTVLYFSANHKICAFVGFSSILLLLSVFTEPVENKKTLAVKKTAKDE